MLLQFVITLTIAISGWAHPDFSNINSYKSRLGFTTQYQKKAERRLKVAIFDKGFKGFESELGRTLPADTRYIAGPVPAPEQGQTEHGLRMAQILVSLMTNDLQATQFVPELSLYNVFGFSNLKAAVDSAIANQVDLILYSEVWEYGGNSDGRGFINKEVSRATQAGIHWINAAGNFETRTYNTVIATSNDDWVQLPDQNQALKIICQSSNNKNCSLRAVLSWNDFKDDVDLGTDKDLDLALTDDLLNIIQVGGLKQTLENDVKPGFSKYPREIITAELKPGTYFLRVKDRSKNFDLRDSLRITVDGDFIQMPSATLGESLINPADNRNVITVGANDSDRSSRSVRLGKPEILAPSSLQFKDGKEYRGSSNAAAIVAAIAGLGLSQSQGDLSKDQLVRYILKFSQNSRGLSLAELGFSFTGPGCFYRAQLGFTPDYVQRVLDQGGVLVQTTAGVRIMVPFDPVTLHTSLYRRQRNDMIVTLPQGYFVYNRLALIPQGAAEVFQTPLEADLCAN